MTDSPARVRRLNRLERFALRRRWNTRDGLRYRAWSFLTVHEPWWDWGHRLMVLTGTNDCGNWSAPSPATWWYTAAPAARMWRTGYPRQRYRVVKDYAQFKTLTEGLDEDGLYEWKAINASQDGEIQLGHQYWGGRFYGLDYAELRLVRSYLRRWHWNGWLGARSWLYSQGLHAAVHKRRPRSCAQVPPPRSGGYDHWHCELRRGHEGVHRYREMEWGHVVDGQPVNIVMKRTRP